MMCPYCQKETKVIDSRVIQGGEGVRRRRKCSDCAFRFSTLEEARILDLYIVKRDGRREPYHREKLKAGLNIALRKRSHTSESLSQLLRYIELQIQGLRQTELTSSQLGEIVMDNLRDFDKVGYIRFASVYRQFEDMKTFEEEINELKQNSYGDKSKSKRQNSEGTGGADKTA